MNISRVGPQLLLPPQWLAGCGVAALALHLEPQSAPFLARGEPRQVSARLLRALDQSPMGMDGRRLISC